MLTQKRKWTLENWEIFARTFIQTLTYLVPSNFPDDWYICGVEENRGRFQNSQKAFDNFLMARRGLRFQWRD